jgi:hypothetical protein
MSRLRAWVARIPVPRARISSRAYLEYVLTYIADHQVKRIDELSPWNVAEASAPIATCVELNPSVDAR